MGERALDTPRLREAVRARAEDGIPAVRDAARALVGTRRW